LSARTLRKPLEATLHARDGVSPSTLLQAVRALLDSGHPLAVLCNDYRAMFEREVPRLHLHPSTQLLLTVAESGNKALFEHAIHGMALAGALAASQGSDAAMLRMALLGGLLHDLGELYIHPRYLDRSAELDVAGFRIISAHPRIGRLLISEMTDYPAALSQAIDEHHLRLDGTGYPDRGPKLAISELGRLLAVVETILGVTETGGRLPLTRAWLALRLVSSEFDQRWSGVVAHARRRLEGALGEEAGEGDAAGLLADLTTRLAKTLSLADALTTDATPPGVRHMARVATQRLHVLRHAWNDSGLWAVAESGALTALTIDEELMAKELRYRLRAMQRDICMRSEPLDEQGKELLKPLLEALGG
jgi:hypothetical protein